MTNQPRRLHRMLCTAALAGLATGTLSVGVRAQGNPNPGVFPVHAHAFGETYGEWSAAWWQWALAIDGNVNPIEDPDGGFANIGQSGKVWFLAGSSPTAGGQLVEREVTIPAGKAIFFPVLNSVWVTVPYLGDPPFAVPGAEEAARAAIAVDPDTDDLIVEIDGTPLRELASYRVQSPVFTVELPEFNWFDIFFSDFFDITAGIYADCVSDGYWILLAPLSKGHHMIHLRGENDGSGFITEVRYHVTVR